MKKILVFLSIFIMIFSGCKSEKIPDNKEIPTESGIHFEGETILPKEDPPEKMETVPGKEFEFKPGVVIGKREPLENSWVLRISSPSEKAEVLFWNHSKNEKQSETDRPVILIESSEELKSFVMDMEGIYFQGESENSAGSHLKKYGEDFFENSVLLISHIRSGSGSVKYEVIGADIREGKCVLTVSAKIPEIGTADIADWLVICEKPKEFFEGAKDFTLEITTIR
ncbi:MAG: hypothetical protein IJO22_04735 [Oscillospiraceae bacterium]|nr:hypothetical protein [Oscillospiraceae bacterium]